MNERRSRRKPGENRARLLEAGLIEFGLFGYHGASTSAIAARADVPQPHVYANFGSKQELFAECLRALYPRDAEQSDGPDQSDGDLREFSTDEGLLLYQGIAASRAPDLEVIRPLLREIREAYGVERIDRALRDAAARLLQTSA